MANSAESHGVEAVVEAPSTEIEETIEQVASEGPSSEQAKEIANQAAEAAVEASEVEKLLLDPKCLRAVHLASRERCVSVEDVAAELGASRQTVEGCLDVLADLGLVAQGPGGRYCHFKAVEEMAEKLRRAIEN